MIDPITGAALTSALTGITGEMTGLTLAEAWNQQGFVDPIDAGYDVDFGVKAGILGKDKPAISGDTSNSISDSQQSDPVDAWHDYVENEPSSVDRTTGGIVDGSSVGVFPYSLLETFDEETQTNIVKAVATVAIPIEQAYTAIAQALGVSMNAAEMEVETKQAFANSIINGQDLIYDKARGLVKAWWDGVRILFPKATVQAVEDTIEDLGIGEGAEYVQPDGTFTVTSTTKPSKLLEALGIGGYLFNYANVMDTVNAMFALADSLYVDGAPTCVKLFYSSVAYNGYPIEIRIGPASILGQTATWSSISALSYFIRASGSKAANVPFSSLSYSQRTNTSYTYRKTYTDSNSIYLTGINLEVVVEGFPPGTEQSDAPSYTVSSMSSGGGIASSSDSVIPTLPINLPADPLNTIGSTADPVTTPTTPEQEENLPAPPIPLPIPDNNISNPDVPLVNSSVVNAELVDQIVEELANTLDPQAPQSSGIIPFPPLPSIEGQYPSIIPASGSGLIHVYNPTPGEFVSFGNWLWVTYADASIDKIWNNPFDGIIGAFELYSTPQTDGSDNIRSGFLVCPTTSALVRQRYTEIDCGTVIVPEFYGNYLDYSPYSQAYIYLPFIGINEVSIDDIVGHAINIRYRIDAYNGSCIAMIYVAKDGYRNLCYQFAGNCAVEVPLAGGSQAAIKAGVLQAEAYARSSLASAALTGAAAIGSGLASGGLAGGLLGGLSALGGMAGAWYGGQQGVEAARVANKSSVQHSGQFGASHGAMGVKKPFIIIRNPIQVKVVNYNEEYGFPAHKRVIIGGCTGYLRVREVNVVSAHATDEEKGLIEALLKNGVYVS